MKNLKLNDLNVQELKKEEMCKIQGGGIPIKMGDFSFIDTTFATIRENFDAESKKMEEELSKFRTDLMSRVSNFFR